MIDRSRVHEACDLDPAPGAIYQTSGFDSLHPAEAPTGRRLARSSSLHTQACRAGTRCSSRSSSPGRRYLHGGGRAGCLSVFLFFPTRGGGHHCIYGANGSGVSALFTVISAREQHRTGGRAGGGCVEVCEPDSSVAGDAVDVRSLDLAAEAACIREAQVIGDNQKEIRS